MRRCDAEAYQLAPLGDYGARGYIRAMDTGSHRIWRPNPEICPTGANIFLFRSAVGFLAGRAKQGMRMETSLLRICRSIADWVIPASSSVVFARRQVRHDVPDEVQIHMAISSG